MSKKMGRPKLPKGEQKSTQLGVRFNASQDKAVSDAAKNADQNKADWIREAAIEKAQVEQLYVRSKWSLADLNGKPVEFTLPTEATEPLRGIGHFNASEAPVKGKLFIDLFCNVQVKPFNFVQFRFRLTQPLADLIEKHPDESFSGYRLLGGRVP